MGLKQEDDLRLAERAAQWLGRLDEPDAERTAFFNWLAESPRHVDALLSTLATAQEIATLTPGQQTRIERMASEGDDAIAANVVTLGDASHADSARQVRKPRAGGIAAGIAAAALVGLGAWLAVTSMTQSYATAVGEQRVLELEDGSLIHLNTRSRLEVHYTDDARSIRLLEGQVLFDVKRDAGRPFRVSSGEAVIQAVGTQFDVYRRTSGTRVAVIEGAVRISPQEREAAKEKALLAAGESADISAQGKIIERKSLNLAQAVAWRQRRLVFREDTLGAIAAEFNRYNERPQIRVEGAAAMDQRFSGTFDADAPEALMQAIAGDETLSVERIANEIVIRKR